MSIVVRFNPKNVTQAMYDESVRRLEEAGAWPNPDGLQMHVLFGSEATCARPRSGTRENNSKPSVRR